MLINDNINNYNNPIFFPGQADGLDGGGEDEVLLHDNHCHVHGGVLGEGRVRINLLDPFSDQQAH